MIAEKVAKKVELTSSSFLFYGIKGCGKHHTAIKAAKLLLCETKTACNKCNECKRINENLHPNILYIEPENKDIKIDRVREVISNLVFSPAENKKRFIIVKEAHRFNSSSGNALLKTLEEPPANTTFILLSSSLHSMLPTIISRCELIKFAPLQSDTIADILGVDKNNRLLQYSMGSASKANFFIENEAVVNKLIAFINRPVDNYSLISQITSELIEICEKDFELIEYFVSLIMYLLTIKTEELIAKNQEVSDLLETINKTKKISNKFYYNTSPLIVFENMLLGLV